MKKKIDKLTKPDDFQMGDVVLQLDAPHEEKVKHGQIYHLWRGP